MFKFLCQFIKEESGQGVAEYGSVLGLAAVIAVIAMSFVHPVTASLPWTSLTTSVHQSIGSIVASGASTL